MADRKLQVVISGDASSLQRAYGQAQTATQRLGSKLTSVGSRMTRGLTLPLIGAGVLAAKTAIDFEAAFTGVTKTVEGTDAQLSALRRGIREMAKEIPATTTEIAAIAEAAGALGIKTDAVLGFTRTMIDLGETTDLTADMAANAFARIANIMGTSQKSFDRLGSTVVDLGNKTASTESEITEMALRLAGAGKQVGLTESDLLGLAATLASVGVRAEAGGSAFSRVMADIAVATEEGGDALDDFADVAGMTTAAFKEQFETDAAGAITAFVEGLDKMQEAGGPVFQTLEKLGLSELRVRDALLRTAGAGDLLRTSLQTGDTAWRENTALTIEAEKRYATTAAGLEILRNNVADLAIKMSKILLPAVQAMVAWVSRLAARFSSLSSGTRKTILIVGGLVAALGPLVYITGTVIKVVRGLSVALVFLAANPVVAVIAGIAALAGGLVIAYNKSRAFREDVQGLIGVAGRVVAALGSLAALVGGVVVGAFNAAKAAVSGVVSVLAQLVSWAQSGISALSSLASAITSLPSMPSLTLPGPLEFLSHIPGLAHGGPATAGSPYIVGERGPELFVPSRSGRIDPKVGGDTITNYNIDARGSRDPAEVERSVERALDKHLKRQGRVARARLA